MVYVNTFASQWKQQIRFESHSVKKLSHFETVINLKQYTSDVVKW